jgi:hypothetical protein
VVRASLTARSPATIFRSSRLRARRQFGGGTIKLSSSTSVRSRSMLRGARSTKLRARDLMRILCPIVLAQALLVASRQSDFGPCRAVGAQLVDHQHLGGKALFLEQLAQIFTAAALLRRRCTSKSRTSPSSSTARQSQNCLPAIVTAISSRRHCAVDRGRRRRSSRANNRPNFQTHRRTVSQETSRPRSASRSSTSR